MDRKATEGGRGRVPAFLAPTHLHWKLDRQEANGYPQGIITYNVNDVLIRNRNKPRSRVSTVPKKDIIILLPYLGPLIVGLV